VAELDLYLTENDELPLVAAAFQAGCKLIPDLHYASARYDSLNALEDYKLFRTRTRQFFLLSEKYSKCPLEMRLIEKEDKSVYYIGGRGGPTIAFLGGGLFNEDASKFIRPGFISYSPRYENTAKKTMEKPPAELIETYQALVKSIKKFTARIKPGNRVYWLGPDARKEVENGAKLVGYEKLSAESLLAD
jgi:hypothetical protein